MASEGIVTIVKLNNSESNSSIAMVAENTSCSNNDDRATNDTIIEVLK